jgi:transaldolase/glucose-6-phosphate isomerase
MTKIHDLAEQGQSVWYDYILRSFITSGRLKGFVDQGIRGVTSNPSIFAKAITGSADYDRAMVPLIRAGKSDFEIYEALALEDIREAAAVLRPVYDQTDGLDGYVSLEVDPALAHDTDGTIAEARRLFKTLGLPNVMIKVPATPAGVPAITTLISEGININVTLIFSLGHYEAIAGAYIAGLEKLAANGGDVRKVASVASLFISRLDTLVDKTLEQMGETGLLGKIGIANTKMVYVLYQELFSGERWDKLAAQGARVQRPLWASTSTKNPKYPDTMYVDNLIGPDTVNTIPPATVEAFLDHGQIARTIDEGLEEARRQLEKLALLGIDLDAVTQQLQDDGVAAFANSFDGLIESIAEKREKLVLGWDLVTTHLGEYQAMVDAALVEMRSENIIERIWAHDHTVWKPESTEIANRLGWLDIAERMTQNLSRLEDLVKAIREAGYTHVLLLGMGGSSLAPEVFRKTFGVRDGYLDLSVLDSTDPGAVLAYVESLDLSRTLFIVATKSGGTVETLSFFKFFYNRVADTLGIDQVGEHFVAITDPGSRLDELAQKYHFRDTFLNDPNIGGRYSALSFFGLVPAALVGVDLRSLLERAMAVSYNCLESTLSVEGGNYGASLGAVMGALARAGRDKLTLVTSPDLASFSDWIEQLVAESTGKEGVGILPVVGEPVGPAKVYGDDRLFLYLKLEGEDSLDQAIQDLEEAGHPVVRVSLRDRYDLGGQFFLWEMATAVASYFLRINPFNQPNVEAAKVLARRMVAAYQETGTLPESDATPLSSAALRSFLDKAEPGAYLSVQVYAGATPEIDQALTALRLKLRDLTGLAVTVGYGPRFLHSTGQLHKGDAGKGLFIQITRDTPVDAPIPDEAGKRESSITFGTLIMAQALGDGTALKEAGREVIRFHLGEDLARELNVLTEALR